MPGVTNEQMQEAHLKNEMNHRKKILKVAFDGAYELIGLGNDPKIKNKIVAMAANHKALMDDAWSLYYWAENKYYDFLKEVAPKQEDNVYPFYAEKIRDVETDYNEISNNHTKLSNRLKDIIEDKTKQ